MIFSPFKKVVTTSIAAAKRLTVLLSFSFVVNKGSLQQPLPAFIINIKKGCWFNMAESNKKHLIGTKYFSSQWSSCIVNQNNRVPNIYLHHQLSYSQGAVAFFTHIFFRINFIAQQELNWVHPNSQFTKSWESWSIKDKQRTRTQSTRIVWKCRCGIFASASAWWRQCGKSASKQFKCN